MTNEMTAKEVITYLEQADTTVYKEIKTKTAEALEIAIKALKQQPCEDCISREEVQDLISRWLSDYLLDETREALETINYKVGDMPSVTPQYTDEEIDKAQAVEQAYVDKMVELAVEESRREWLNSFDTSSATKCFEAVNLLKQRLEGEE